MKGMTLVELLNAGFLNEGCSYTIYTETEEVYSGNFPHWADIPAKYMKSKVVCVTARELKFCIRIQKGE